jgi:4'-phosphopantetheinyl transferase
MKINPWRDSFQKKVYPSADIQLWSAFFDLEDSDEFYHLLSEEEKNQAARLKNNKTARQKIISRGILRLLLGDYLQLHPEELIFQYSPFGKPFLSNPEAASISFNLAHSGNLLLIAIGYAVALGVDIEKIDEEIDINGISTLSFSFPEKQILSHSKNPIRDFYAIWTAKEAILKVSGLGFAYPSNQFSVVLEDEKVSTAIIPNELSGGKSFSLFSLLPLQGYSGALAQLR